MKKKKLKTKQLKLWQEDLPALAQFLAEQSDKGWHIYEIDAQTDTFIFEKGLPRQFLYFINMPAQQQNILMEKRDEDFPEYMVAVEHDDIDVFRKELDSRDECIEKEFEQEESLTEELEWLADKMAQGKALIGVHDNYYYFEGSIPEAFTFQIVEAKEINDEKLQEQMTSGGTYICSSNDKHYFISGKPKEIEKTNETIQLNKKRIEENKIKQARNIMSLALFGVVLALAKLIFDFYNWTNAAGELLEKLQTRMIMDGAALAICFAIVIGFMISYIQARKRMKEISSQRNEEQDSE